MKRLLWVVLVLMVMAGVAGCEGESQSAQQYKPTAEDIARAKARSSWEPPRAVETQTASGVGSFVEEHPEFGSVVWAEDKPDWAQGQRQLVKFCLPSGKLVEYILYLKDGKVVAVRDKQLAQVWP